MTNRMVMMVVIMVIGIIVCSYSPKALSDSSSYYEADGATVYPVKNKNIVLQNEVVKIKAYSRDPQDSIEGKTWAADCDFIFYNKTDSTQSVTMGYPDWVNDYFDPDHAEGATLTAYQKYLNSRKRNQSILERNVHGEGIIYRQGYLKGKIPYDKSAWIVQGLKVLVEGLPVHPTHRPSNVDIDTHKRFSKEFVFDAKEPEGAFIWPCTFKPRETKTVKVKFIFSGLCDIDYQEVSYLLKSGALWADSIGAADIFWDLDGRKYAVMKIHPSNYVLKDHVIHWHFENFKPTENISLFLSFGDFKFSSPELKK